MQLPPTGLPISALISPQSRMMLEKDKAPLRNPAEVSSALPPKAGPSSRPSGPRRPGTSQPRPHPTSLPSPPALTPCCWKHHPGSYLRALNHYPETRPHQGWRLRLWGWTAILPQRGPHWPVSFPLHPLWICLAPVSSEAVFGLPACWMPASSC